MKIKINIIVGVALALFTQSAVAQQSADVFPSEDWEFDKCNTIQGIRPFVIDSMNTTGLLIIHSGKIVFSYGNIQELSYIASCRKSILAMLYGPYVENGIIDLSQTLTDLEIDDVNGLLPIEKTATIADILAAKSGVFHPSSYPGDDLAFAPERGSQQPGAYFLYNNWDFNVAGAIFEQLTQTNVYDALENTLAIPLKMQDFDRSIQRKTGNLAASKYPAYPMYLSVRDMARIGYLMLRKGRWMNTQVIPAQWVEKMTSIATPNAEMHPLRLQESSFGYGYLWWIFDQENQREELNGAYTAQGLYGQFITVIPKLDLVIAHKTNAQYQRYTTNYEQLVDLIIDNTQYLKEPQIAVAEDHFQDYTGKYGNEQLTMEIFVDHGTLYMTSPLGKLTLIPCDSHHFSFVEEDRFSLLFDVVSGKVTSFTLSPDTMGMGVFIKKD